MVHQDQDCPPNFSADFCVNLSAKRTAENLLQKKDLQILQKYQPYLCDHGGAQWFA
jgi:hypothetical protein